MSGVGRKCEFAEGWQKVPFRSLTQGEHPTPSYARSRKHMMPHPPESRCPSQQLRIYPGTHLHTGRRLGRFFFTIQTTSNDRKRAFVGPAHQKARAQTMNKVLDAVCRL